ncbi:hypothetical protein C8Q80DRAFT_1123222 [Daedaleopsis nitida]|nr:hypothetical protein C8Q80DRAFT_1123222 [Daedaleopsis nitida]
MAILPIFVAQYYVGHGPYGLRPYGWHIVVQTGVDRYGEPVGNMYFVRGTTVGRWEPQVRRNVRYRAISAYRGAARVGEVDAKHLEDLEDQLARAEILQHNPGWGYQDWVCGALRRLHAHDFRVDDLVWKRMGAVMRNAEEAYNMFRD